MTITSFIYQVIRDNILDDYGFNCWLSRKYIIVDRINSLKPGLPEDNTSGYIAYDVPGKNRMKMRTTRFLTRKLNLNNGFLSDKIISRIAESINDEYFSKDIDIRLVNGSKITKHYENETGARSCMTTNGCGGGPNCTKLYENNPDRFQMLVMFYQNDSARAIVHKLDNGQYYMDRVYGSCGLLIDKMRQYAIEQDWAYRLSNDACGYAVCGSRSNELVVSGLDYIDGEVPYMDTLINGCLCGQGLSISKNGCCDVELLNTDGSLDGGYVCVNCGYRCSEDNHTVVNDYVYCYDCDSELFSVCEDCCEHVNPSEITHIENTDLYLCEYCRDRGKYIYCEDCDTWHCEAESYHIEDMDLYVCDNCLEKYHYCEDCCEYNQDMTIVKSEDRYVCDNCLSNYHKCAECGDYFDDVSENRYCEDCDPDADVVELITCKHYPGQINMEFNHEN